MIVKWWMVGGNFLVGGDSVADPNLNSWRRRRFLQNSAADAA
jgi:hypothetical protein